MTKKTSKPAAKLIAEIAKTHLGFKTLETQRTGADFRECATWCVKAALEAAYLAGRQAARAPARPSTLIGKIAEVTSARDERVFTGEVADVTADGWVTLVGADGTAEAFEIGRGFNIKFS